MVELHQSKPDLLQVINFFIFKGEIAGVSILAGDSQRIVLT
jgi:hypothetical protein